MKITNWLHIWNNQLIIIIIIINLFFCEQNKWMNAKITLKTKTKTKTDKLKKLMGGRWKNGKINIIQDNIL